MKNSLMAFMLIFFCFQTMESIGQDNYEIKVTLDNYKEKTLYLGYHLGGKQYLTDTTEINDKGEFIFSKNDTLPSGLYLIVMQPENRYFEFMIDEKFPHFGIHVDAINPFESIEFTNSKENSDYYSYLHNFSNVRKEYEKLNTEQSKEEKDTPTYKKIETQKEQLKTNSFAYQDSLIKQNPQSFLSLILLANKIKEIPEFEGTDEEVQLARYHFAKKHYFDYLNLKDDRLLRTPFIDSKLDYYLDKMTPQHPDSISISVDNILERMSDTSDLYQFYVVKYLNKFANSKFVGFDAVYVHIAEKYYASGKAPWASKESLSKITKQATVLENLLIGKIAPNIELQRKDKSKVSLYDVKDDYTVLFFWSPNCGHCKKSMPKVIDFYNKFNSKGVEIFAVCTMLTDKVKDCWEFIDTKETGMQNWMNLVDPYLKSKYKQIYDVRSTPTIYILDKNKKILSKRIGADQLEDVMNKIMEMKANEEKESDQ